MKHIKDRTGETNTHNKTGLLMTIIAYRKSTDIDIEFEDGVIVHNKDYRCFKLGVIARPEYDNYTKLGETNIANNGQKMTIIRYNNWLDIDIQFEDGTIVKHKKYDSFRYGRIAHPNISSYKKHKNQYTEERKNKFIGLKTTTKDGHQITITKYNNTSSITVQFEDGVIKNTTYKRFLHRDVSYPPNRIGQTNIATNGQQMTIIDYRKVDDIDVQFEDGTIVNHRCYSSFIKGNIKNPNHKINTDLYIGKSCINVYYGISMNIIKYCSYNNIDVQFETGYINKNNYYANFRKGKIGHPFPYQMNNICIEKLAYIDSNNTGQFYCTCNKCGHQDIWTLEETKNHICEVFNE